MKNILVMVGAGIGLFVVTALGLLFAQGRLNYEGSRGIPLLSSFFSAPEKDATESKEPADTKRDADQPKLAGHEKPIPFKKGTSILKPEPSKDEHGGGQDEKASGHAADAEKTDAAKHEPAPAQDREKPSEWENKVEDLLGEGRYRRGRLFKFPTLEGGMSVDELNGILARARALEQKVQDEQRALEKKKAGLDTREADIADRQKAVADLMTQVHQEQQKLEQKVAEFEKSVLVIKQDEEKGLVQIGRMLASWDAKKAAALVLEMWQSEEEQTKAIKILSVMEAEAADAIVGEFQTRQIKDFVTKRLKVAREEQRAQKGK